MIPLTTEAQLNRAIITQLDAKMTGKTMITAELQYQVSPTNGPLSLTQAFCLCISREMGAKSIYLSSAALAASPS